MHIQYVKMIDWGSLLVQVTLVGRDHYFGWGGAFWWTEGWRIASSGCFPHQDVGQQQLAELFHDDVSLFWPLINSVAWVPFFFFLSQKNMLVLSCCIFQSSMTMVSGLAACLCVRVCGREHVCASTRPYSLWPVPVQHECGFTVSILRLVLC